MSPDQVTTAAPDDEPVLATIVPPTPSPWQFGLKSLLGLMVVCSVQFALMSYLNVFWGLLTGVGLCFAALAILLLWAVLFVRSRSSLMERLDFVGIRLVVGIAVLLVGTILAGGGTAVAYVVGNMWMAMDLEKDFGIRTRAASLGREANLPRSENPHCLPGSDAQLAGIQQGEVIVIDGTIDEFYENMQQNRGKQLDINVAAAPVGGSIEKTPRRTVTITVPK
jgi:hypothetical protein